MSEPFISADKRGNDGLLPQSLEAEQALLGAVLADSECLTRVFEFIPKGDFFYKKAHQLIFQAFYELSEKNDNIDVITTSQHLKDKGELEDIGGRSYLSALTDHAPIAANAEYYAKIVKSKYLLRSLISTGNEIVSLGYQSEEDLDKLLDKAEQMVFGLAQSKIQDNLTHIGDIVQASWEILEQREANKGALLGVDTGFYDLNAITAGLQKSDLIILAARPAMGKCLQKDSEIVLADGSIATIEEVYKQKKANLLTLNPDWKLSLTEASDFIDDGIKPIFKVTTRLGREVKTTITHPYLTINGWKKLEEVKVGDKIAIPRKINVFGNSRIEECRLQLIADEVLERSNFSVEADFSQNYISTEKLVNAKYIKASHFPKTNWSPATDCYSRIIPNEINTLRKSQITLFLAKIFQGKQFFKSLNKKLVRELQHLLLRLGEIASIKKGADDRWELKIIDINKNNQKGDIYWDEITSIEYLGEDQVYDLTIPDTHNFVANDICVHNTSLALNIGESVAVLNNKPVAVFSLEMSKEQLVQRLLCSNAQVDSNRIRTGQLYPEDWTRLGEAMSELGEAPLYIDDSAGLSVMELRGKCRRLMAEKGDLGLVIVDYLQLMEGKSSDSRINQISEISRGLKMLARELNVPIMALSQLSRAVEARQDKKPMLSDLRESGSLEQDSDIVMFVYRDEYYNPESEKKGMAEVIIAKQRSGPVGTIELLFQSNITKFRNPVKEG